MNSAYSISVTRDLPSYILHLIRLPANYCCRLLTSGVKHIFDIELTAGTTFLGLVLCQTPSEKDEALQYKNELFVKHEIMLVEVENDYFSNDYNVIKQKTSKKTPQTSLVRGMFEK